MAHERGLYQIEAFNGMTEYHLHNHEGTMICRVVMMSEYAGALCEERMQEWLDMVDPVVEPRDGTGVILPAASLAVAALLSSSLSQAVA